MKEKIYLVLESKRHNNLLAYNLKTSEYIYFHNGKELWREKEDKTLFDYCNETINVGKLPDEEILNKSKVYNKYSKSCIEIQNIEMQKILSKFNNLRLSEAN